MLTHEDYAEYLLRFGLHAAAVPNLLPQVDMQILLGKLRQAKPSDSLDRLLEAADANSTNVLMQNMSANITQRVAAHGFPDPIETFTGIFPTNSFNAQAVRWKDGALILMDVGCFTLLESLTLLWAWSSERERSVAIACRIVAAYAAEYTLPEANDYDHPSLHDGTRLMAYSVLLSKAEEFMLAHEHAHAALGHLWQEDSKSSWTPAGEAKLITKSIEQEREADRLGLHLLFPAQGTSSPLALRQTSAAPYIAFGTAMLIEQALSAAGQAKYPSADTHPPASVRLAQAEKQLHQWGFSSHMDLGQRYLSWIEECCEMLSASTTDHDRLAAAVWEQSSPPLVNLPKQLAAPRVAIYVRSSVITTRFDGHERQLLKYCEDHGWNPTVYRDRKGGEIDPEKLEVLMKTQQEGKFKPGGFELFFALLLAASGAKPGWGNGDPFFGGLAQLLTDAREGKIDVAIVYDLGRLGPDKLGVFRTVTALQENGVTVIVPRLGVLDDNTIYPNGLDYE